MVLSNANNGCLLHVLLRAAGFIEITCANAVVADAAAAQAWGGPSWGLLGSGVWSGVVLGLVPGLVLGERYSGRFVDRP